VLVAGVAAAVITARYLGPEGRGHLALFVTAASLGSAVFGVGVPIASYDLAVSRPQRTRGVLAAAASVALLAGAASAAAGSVLFRGDVIISAALAMSVAGTLISTSAAMILVAAQRVDTAALLQGLPAVCAAGGYVVVLVVLGGSWRDASVAYALASAVALVVALVLAWRTPGSVRPVSLPSLVARGLKAWLGDVANLLSYRVDMLLIAFLVGAGPLGRYATGVQLVEPNWIAASALATAVMALAPGSLGRKGAGQARTRADPGMSRDLAAAVRGAVLVAAGGCATVGVVMSVAARPLLGLGFDSVATVVFALLPGVTCLAASKVVAAAVIASGRIGMSSVVSTLSLAANIAANLVLIPALADVGAGLSSSLSYALSAALWLVAWRHAGGRMRIRDLIPRRGDLATVRGLLVVHVPSRRRVHVP